MDKKLFRRELYALFKFFERPADRMPEKAVVDEWYAELKTISDNAFRAAIKTLKKNGSLPYKVSIPKAIKNALSEFLRTHPTIILDPVPYDDCKECKKSGAFRVLIYNPKAGRRVEYEVLCGDCNNWKKVYNDPLRKRVSAKTLRKNRVPFKPSNKIIPVVYDDFGYIDGNADERPPRRKTA